MDKKTIGIIATVGTLFLCACPSLFLCIWGVIGVSGVPIDQTINGQTTTEPMSMGLGIALLCLSIVGLLTPVVVGFFTLRKKPEDTAINAVPMSDPAVESDPFKKDAPDNDPFDNDDFDIPPTS